MGARVTNIGRGEGELRHTLHQYAHPLGALIFDVDGTLAETEEAHRAAFNRAFRAQGLDWRWDRSLYGELLAVTGGRERILHYIERYESGFEPVVPLEALARQLHRHKTLLYAERIAQHAVPLRPGVERLLGEAREAGLRLAIATTTSLENVTALLESTLGDSAVAWFDVIAAGDVVSRKKPAPDIYLYTLQCLGLQARDCMALEDSWNGLHSALGAGITTVVTLSEYTRREDFAGASVVVDQLGEPGTPCRVLAGNTFGRNVITMELLRQLHETKTAYRA